MPAPRSAPQRSSSPSGGRIPGGRAWRGSWEVFPHLDRAILNPMVRETFRWTFAVNLQCKIERRAPLCAGYTPKLFDHLAFVPEAFNCFALMIPHLLN